MFMREPKVQEYSIPLIFTGINSFPARVWGLSRLEARYLKVYRACENILALEIRELHGEPQGLLKLAQNR